jgi:hypothetical protein
LGEFSPNGRSLTLGSFLKIAVVAQFLGATLFHSTSYVLIWAKQGLGYILGDFFTNSSGHSASVFGRQGDQIWLIFANWATVYFG